MLAGDGVACAEGGGEAVTRRPTVPVEVFRLQLGVFEPVKGEPPGLERIRSSSCCSRRGPGRRVASYKNRCGRFALRAGTSCDAAWEGLDSGIMGAENGGVKRTEGGGGSGRGWRPVSRGARNDRRRGRGQGLLPGESLLQAADLYVEQARLEDGFVFGVDERQIFFG